MVNDPKLAKLGWARLQEAITLLVGMGHLIPCWGSGPPSAEAVKKAKAFNTAVVERSAYSGDLEFLASPVTGNAIAVDRLQQFFILSSKQKKVGPVEFSLSMLGKINQKIIKNGVTVETEEEARNELQKRYNIFEKRIPILKKLGVI